MKEWLNEFLSVYRQPYFVRQLLVIVLLYILGLAVCLVLLSAKSGENAKGSPEENDKLRLAICLAFPTGLAVFILAGYVFLAFGLSYTALPLAIVSAVIFAAALAGIIKKKLLDKTGAKLIGISLAVCILLALIAASGYIKISISNDSLYYFWQYPRAIVKYKGLRDQFDNFLTDTGLGAAVIGTLPHLYGFGESFGIQEFFHMSFILFFGNAVYTDTVKECPETDHKKARVIAILGMTLMAVCTPAYILAHWAMANMYFMEFFFICMWLVRHFWFEGGMSDYVLLALLAFSCASVRMEGALFVLLIIAAGVALKTQGKKLFAVILPVVLIESYYELMIFAKFNIDNPFTFLTKGKALLQLAAFIVVGIYLLFINDRVSNLLLHTVPMIVLAVLILVNVEMMISDMDRYIGNLKTFLRNLTGQSGWGMLPYLSLSALIVGIFIKFAVNRDRRLLSAGTGIRHKGSDLMMINRGIYWLAALIGFLLTAFAAAFARGDALDVATGDSGNRVMLQIAPFVIYFFVCWYTHLAYCGQEKAKDSADIEE